MFSVHPDRLLFYSPTSGRPQMSHNLNSLKGGYIGVIQGIPWGITIGLTKGDTRGLDYSLNDVEFSCQ